MLAVLSLVAFGASVSFANPEKVTLSCSLKNGTVSSFVLSFDRPEDDSFSVPVEISASRGTNSGTLEGFVESAFTRLKGYYMLSISSKGPLGPLRLELAADPDFSRAFGHGTDNTSEILFLDCEIMRNKPILPSF